MTRRSRSDQRDRGQTLVEFALILPIFVLLLVGIFDFGRAIYAYNTINNAAREAVRVGIVNQNIGAIRNEATKQSVSLGVTGADVTVTFLEADYTASTAGETCATAPRRGCVVEVDVAYDYVAATPVVGNLVGTLNLTGLSQQPIERTYASP